MPESSIVVRPEPMHSATYTESSRLQAAGLLPAVALFERSAAIEVLRRRTRDDHAILVAHNDVPDNDFTALFRTLADDPDSYLHHDPASFTSAIGRSFYSQILPTNTPSTSAGRRGRSSG